MRIHYMSDVHLEFGALDAPMPDGDILILGGDITLLNAFDPEDDYVYQKRSVLRERTEVFLESCRESFERIFYLIGNHEAYGYDLTKAPKIIKTKLKGVELLENKVVDLGSNVILAGATLWTDMNKGLDAYTVSRGMNDFCGAIVVEDKPSGHRRAGHALGEPEGKEGTRTPGEYRTRRFTTDDAIKMFNKSQRFISKTADANKDKIVVVATHHAPSIQGINRQHVMFSRINAGYYTPLEDFIEAHPSIKVWIHGHTHIQKTYTISQCQVLSNARGYINREHSADVFDPDCWFDPVTGERSKGPPTEEEIKADQEASIDEWRKEHEPMDSNF